MRHGLAVLTLCMGLVLMCQTGCGGSGGGNVADNPDAEAATAYEAAIKADQAAMNENKPGK